MSYSYEKERAELFTEKGVRMLMTVRDNVRRLLDVAEAFRADKAWADVSGDSWMMLATLDYLVEIKEINMVCDAGVKQHCVYVRGFQRLSIA